MIANERDRDRSPKVERGWDRSCGAAEMEKGIRGDKREKRERTGGRGDTRAARGGDAG